MKAKTLMFVALLVVLSMVLAACQPAAPAAEQPSVEEPMEEPSAEEPMEEPATEEPMEEPAMFEPMSLAAPDCEYGGLIKEIAAVDENTVQFTMCVPDPAFPSKAAFTAFSIQPTEWIESAMASGEILEKPIGTGPYYVDSWNRGDSIVFKRFEDY